MPTLTLTSLVWEMSFFAKRLLLTTAWASEADRYSTLLCGHSNRGGVPKCSISSRSISPQNQKPLQGKSRLPRRARPDRGRRQAEPPSQTFSHWRLKSRWPFGRFHPKFNVPNEAGASYSPLTYQPDDEWCIHFGVSSTEGCAHQCAHDEDGLSPLDFCCFPAVLHLPLSEQSPFHFRNIPVHDVKVRDYHCKCNCNAPDLLSARP